eukprot:17525-Heterococcus_DN1.PRE.1
MPCPPKKLCSLLYMCIEPPLPVFKHTYGTYTQDTYSAYAHESLLKHAAECCFVDSISHTRLTLAGNATSIACALLHVMNYKLILTVTDAILEAKKLCKYRLYCATTQLSH